LVYKSSNRRSPNCEGFLESSDNNDRPSVTERDEDPTSQ
jgi:hypothetical protein